MFSGDDEFNEGNKIGWCDTDLIYLRVELLYGIVREGWWGNDVWTNAVY